MGIASEQRSSFGVSVSAHLTPIARIWHSRHDSTWFRRSAASPKHRATILISPRGALSASHIPAAALWPSRENLQSLLIVSLNSFLLNESNLNQFSSLKSRLTFIFIVLEESANSCRARGRSTGDVSVELRRSQRRARHWREWSHQSWRKVWDFQRTLGLVGFSFYNGLWFTDYMIAKVLSHAVMLGMESR